ncbi:helix-turn-helix domain-containing protein [Streptomyces flavidovirens]
MVSVSSSTSTVASDNGQGSCSTGVSQILRTGACTPAGARSAVTAPGGRAVRRGEASSLIAKELRVSVRSVQRWRQAWDEGGPRALRSQGPASLPRRRDDARASPGATTGTC